MSIEIEKVVLAITEIRPNDTVVFRGNMTLNAIENFKKRLGEVYPGTKFLFIPEGIDIEILRNET